MWEKVVTRIDGSGGPDTLSPMPQGKETPFESSATRIPGGPGWSMDHRARSLAGRGPEGTAS